MDYYNEIKEKLLDTEIYGKVKDYSKERHKVITYYETGKLLHEAGSVYGEDIIGNYAKKLMNEVGKKYNKRTLFRIRQFYRMFNNEKVSTVSTQLTWSHYVELLVLKNFDEINYYIKISKSDNLSYRKLHDRIKSNKYGRLSEENKKYKSK